MDPFEITGLFAKHLTEDHILLEMEKALKNYQANRSEDGAGMLRTVAMM